jgi:K+-transporting ATPase KdpF subunit
MSLANAIGLGSALGIAIYLVVALLLPEKFQ